MSSPFPGSGPFVGRRGLYGIVDVEAAQGRGLDFLRVAEELVAGGAVVLQLRAKGRADSFVLAALRDLRVIVAPGAGCLLFANDRPDLAELAGADGVHLGQDDLPAERVREHYPRLLLGLSTHDELQFERALGLDLDYVALGPIFPTSSKQNPDPVVGLGTLEALGERARAQGRALVAIGGVHTGNLAQVRAHAPLWAVIGAVLPEYGELDPYAEIRRRAALLGAHAQVD